MSLSVDNVVPFEADIVVGKARLYQPVVRRLARASIPASSENTILKDTGTRLCTDIRTCCTCQNDGDVFLPLLPLPFAIVICVLNFLFPGFGIMVVCLCWCFGCVKKQTDFETFEDCCMAFCWGWVLLFCTPCCFLGWYLSCEWGVKVVRKAANRPACSRHRNIITQERQIIQHPQEQVVVDQSTFWVKEESPHSRKDQVTRICTTTTSMSEYHQENRQVVANQTTVSVINEVQEKDHKNLKEPVPRTFPTTTSLPIGPQSIQRRREGQMSRTRIFTTQSTPPIQDVSQIKECIASFSCDQQSHGEVEGRKLEKVYSPLSLPHINSRSAYTATVDSSQSSTSLNDSEHLDGEVEGRKGSLPQPVTVKRSDQIQQESSQNRTASASVLALNQCRRTRILNQSQGKQKHNSPRKTTERRKAVLKKLQRRLNKFRNKGSFGSITHIQRI